MKNTAYLVKVVDINCPIYFNDELQRKKNIFFKLKFRRKKSFVGLEIFKINIGNMLIKIIFKNSVRKRLFGGRIQFGLTKARFSTLIISINLKH